MKSSIRRRRLVTFLLAVVLSMVALPLASRAQDAVNTGQSSTQATGESTKAEADPNDAFRHATAVKWIARHIGLPVETTAKIIEDINSGVLIVVILYFLVKSLPAAFRRRRESIQVALVDARSATEQANERLSAVEARLSRLDTEIEAIRQQAEKDGAGDEVRIKQSLEDEHRRIIESAEHEIESAGVAAQRRLKQFAAELAVDRATRELRLTPEADRLLVSDFGQHLNATRNASLNPKPGKGGRN